MQIIVDDNTRGVELYHLSILFQSLAGARGFDVPKPSTSVGEITMKLNIDTKTAVASIDELAAHAASKGVDVTDIQAATYSVDTHPINTSHASIDMGGNISIHTHGIATVAAPADLIGRTGTNGEFIDPIASLPERTTDTNLDINGLPWDARIHAGSRERNTDGSWRVRRKPKTVEQDEWDATLARVTAELTDLMAIPVSPGAVADAAAEEVQVLTDAEVDALVNIVQGVTVDPNDHGYQIVQAPINSDHASVDVAGTITVHVAPPVTIAPPVVVPPVTAVAPPITVDKPSIETFPQVMVWLTAHTPKDEAAKPGMVTKVNQILTDNGLTVLQQLNQRPELIPQIMAQFIEAFGE